MCNGCHDMSMKAISMQNITIIYHNGHAYRVNFAFISKNDAFNFMKNSVIINIKGLLNVNFYSQLMMITMIIST